MFYNTEQLSCEEERMSPSMFWKLKYRLDSEFRGFVKESGIDLDLRKFSVSKNNHRDVVFTPTGFWSESIPFAGVDIFCCARTRMMDFQRYFGFFSDFDWVDFLADPQSGVYGVCMGSRKGYGMRKESNEGTFLVNTFGLIWGDRNPNVYKDIGKADVDSVASLLRGGIDPKRCKIKAELDEMSFMVNVADERICNHPDYLNWEVFVLMKAHFDKSFPDDYYHALGIHEQLVKSV